ncbi:MAG: hypothetical protein SGI86_18155 [Deltaproteobacteria bacterium]|nr:hypothetical protein [Deltaproteobacteria bacterium]
MTYVGNITRDVYREFPVLTVALLAMGAVGCEEANVPLTQVIVVKPDDNSAEPQKQTRSGNPRRELHAEVSDLGRNATDYILNVTSSFLAH